VRLLLKGILGRRGRLGSDQAALVGLACLTLALFPGAFFARGVFFERDINVYWLPQVESMVRSVAEGGWPTWNPFFCFGQPILAEPASQVFYPLTWLNLLLLPTTYYKLFVFVHCVGAGAGLYFLARRWGLSSLSSFLAGAAWISSGPFLSLVSLYHHFAGAAWIPWVLLALDVALVRGTVWSALVLGMAVAAQLLAGSGEMLAIALLMALAWSCFVLPGRRPQISTLARSLFISGATALLLSAAQWMPTLSALWTSSRLDPVMAGNLFWSLHPASLGDLFVPRLSVDMPISSNTRALLFESREPFLPSLYLGMPSLVLVGLVSWRSRTAFFAAAGLFLFLMAALGRNALLLPLLRSLLPALIFRYPVKAMVAVALLWAVLVGLGCEVWLKDWSAENSRRARFVGGGAGLAAVVALVTAEWMRSGPSSLKGWLSVSPLDRAAYLALMAATVSKLRVAACTALVGGALLWWRTWRHRASLGLGVLMAALVVGDLAHAGWSTNPVAPAEIFERRPQVLKVLGPHVESHRVVVFAEAGFFGRPIVRGPAAWSGEALQALAWQEMLIPPIGARWKVRGSYDGDFTGIATPPHSGLSFLLHRFPSIPLALRLLQMGNVGYVVSLGGEGPYGVEKLGEVQSPFEEPIQVFRVPMPLPRSYLVNRVRIGDDANAMAALADPAFDPRQEVLLPKGSPSLASRGDFKGHSSILDSRSDYVKIETETSTEAYLVLVEAYHQGWKTRIDGRPARVVPANLLFRAVLVPQGKHIVEMSYRPPWLLCGMALSGVGLTGVSWAFWRERKSDGFEG